MGKAWMVGAAAALVAGAAQAGSYGVLPESDCPLVSASELAAVIGAVGKATGLDLPKDMSLRAEVRCASQGKAAKAGGPYVYSIRTAIDKQLSDGEHLRWASVAHHTDYGTASGKAELLKSVRFALRDLIRREP